MFFLFISQNTVKQIIKQLAGLFKGGIIYIKQQQLDTEKGNLFCLLCLLLGSVLIPDQPKHPLLSSSQSGPLERRDSDIVRPRRQMALAPGREQVEPTLSILAVTSARTNNKCFHQPAPPCSCLSSSRSRSPAVSCPARPAGSPTREIRSFV